MKCNVLVSFLGRNAYEPSYYYYEKDKSDISRDKLTYVQEFIVKKFCSNWSSADKAFFITTDDTIEYNWRNKAVYNIESRKIEKEAGIGLKSVLESLKKAQIIHFEFENIRIADGDNEEEIWSIFQAIENAIKELNADEIKLYLDITHSFRYLPMLGLVLVNYLKAFQNINVSKILYGNYEKGKLDNFQSPIIDLTSFVTLQDWATISNEFINLGESQNFEKISGSNSALAQKLDDLVKSIKTSRGGKLVYDFDFDEVHHLIQKAKEEDTPNKAQMGRLLSSVEEKIENFKRDDVINGFRAVEWCIEYDLIQQGYTILQETLKTWLLSQFVSDKSKILKHSLRDKAKLALEGRDRYDFDENDEPKTNKSGKKIDYWKNQIGLTQKMFDKIQIEYVEIPLYYGKLKGDKGYRNDVNHAGFKENPASPQELKAELKDLYSNIKTILGIS